ncbi:MAG: asparagine synthase (glutamine-hydrolyzing) [Chloroflexi bacterium]|nr:asparagine synthase (glutamine-hydrolyzing) [Chloroflexota bacterium]
MCGITGAVALDTRVDDSPITAASLEAMCGTLVHRGPDSAGAVVLGAGGLAMRRLSIIDVEGGRQPLASEDGQVQLVCNGEIYNYRQLRERLTANGHRFRSGSDCEVAVHAYEEYGDDFVCRLNGMFGLALWDNRRRRLLLARDRTGIKPLYYARHGDVFLFASEPKAILAYPGFPRALDVVSLYQYLTYEYVPTPRSIFAGIGKLRPGHYLTVENGRIDERPYWQLDLTPDPALAHASELRLADRLWQTLREAVRLELVSDVPLGVFLSGGLDSSAVAAAMSDLIPGQVRSFSIGFEDPSFDESGYARHVAGFLGTQHSEMILEPRLLWELVPRVADFLDEPLADASIIPTHLLSRFARQHVTVALGGDGGDELFAGYPTLQAHRLAGYYRRLPAAIREGIVAPLVRRLPVSYDNMSLDFKAKRFIAGTSRPLAERHHLWLGAYSPDEKRALLRPDVLAQIGAEDTFDALGEHVVRCAAYDDLSQALYLDMKMYLEGDILTKVDRASMGCSLEVRVPLLNRLMLDFATRLPIDLKLRGLTRKYLLRKAVAGRLPDEIINRPKKGFGIPLSKWFRGELRDLLLDQLSDSRLRRQGLFEPAHVDRLIADHLAGRRDNRKPLWTLLVFQLWHQRYIENQPISFGSDGTVAQSGAKVSDAVLGAV